MSASNQRKATCLELDSGIWDLFQQSFTLAELNQLLETVSEIHHGLKEDAESFGLTKSIASLPGQGQIVFDELNALLPEYIRMVRASFDEIGDEDYVEASELDALNLPASGEARIPKLAIDDDETPWGFAFLQVAAFKAGMRDEHLLLWYAMTHMFVHNIVEELESLAVDKSQLH